MHFVWRFTAAIFLLLSCDVAAADTFDNVVKRGSITIGVKPDYKPWSFKDGKGELQGMEVELARDIARRLKVKLNLVPALSSNRVQLLNEGKVDVILATFSVTEERKKQVTFVEPSYYAAMIGVLSKQKSGIGGETTLKGKKICAVAGNYSNKAVTGFVGGDLIEHKTLIEAEDKLRAGECDGVTFDDVVLLYQLKSEAEKWKDYDISLMMTVTPAPWGIGLPLSEKDGHMAKFLSGVVKEWHRRGKLLALEKKWVGDNSMALQWLSGKVKAADAGASVPSSKRKGAPRPSTVKSQ
jgi:polar amino acid transport system substrate-binding protein